jgi:hypothetical protein
MDTSVPLSVECVKCGRRLVIEGYQAASSEVVPKDLITRYYNLARPFFSVLCPCGHYTVSSPFLRDKPIENEQTS